MEKVYNEAIAEKEAQFAEQEAQALYSHLESLRNRYGRKVTVLLGDRAPFCHHADLDISEEDIERGTKIFPEIDEDFPLHNQRHHPYLLLLNTLKSRWTQETVLLLPGETYNVYQDGDDEIVRVEHGTSTIAKYPLTKEHVDKFMTLFEVDSTSPQGQALLALV